MSRKWLTPDTPPPETERGRCFSVPDDISLVGAVTGALVPLTYPENWEQFGSMTPDEAAGVMSAAFEDFVSGECGEGECPPVEVPGLEAPIYRYNPVSTRWEKLEGGEWVEPTGDEEIPPSEPREEPTEAEQECGAASNAANVLRNLYTDILTVYDEEIDPLLNQAEIAAQVAVAIGSKFGPISATFLSLSGIAWEMFTLALQEITEDDWTEAFHEKLVCILNGASEVLEDGSVHFNLYQVCSNLVGFILPVIDAHVRVRWQTWYLLQMIGSQGLDIAGGTTGVEGECATCGEWCVQLTPEELNSYTNVVYGDYDSNGFLLVENVSGTRVAMVDIVLPSGDYQVTRAGLVGAGANYPSTGSVQIYLYNSGGGFKQTWLEYTGNVGGIGGLYISPDNPAVYYAVPGEKLNFRFYAPANAYISALRVSGTGVNPFGVGSNC